MTEKSKNKLRFLSKTLIDSGLSKVQFCEKIGKSRPTLDRWLKNGDFGDEIILLLEKVFNVKYLYVTKSYEQKEKTIDNKPYKELSVLSESTENYKTIPFIATEVFATISPAMSDVVTLKPDTFIKIPMFSRGEYAIQVTGNSMKGFVNNGDWAVIRSITNKNKIIFGECYVVITRDDQLRTIKFLNQDKENDSILWLSPYNIEQFQSQSIEKTDILEIYQVIGIFRRIGS